MTTHNEIEAIERRVKGLSLPMAFVLNRAQVPASTWARWKKGTQGPTKSKWDAVVDAVDDLERRLA